MSSRVNEVNSENLQDPQSKILATPMYGTPIGSHTLLVKLNHRRAAAIIGSARNRLWQLLTSALDMATWLSPAFGSCMFSVIVDLHTRTTTTSTSTTTTTTTTTTTERPAATGPRATQTTTTTSATTTNSVSSSPHPTSRGSSCCCHRNKSRTGTRSKVKF